MDTAAKIAAAAPPSPQIVVTFETWSHQRAFADWAASGEAMQALWAWMGRHGYHVWRDQ